MTIPIIGGVVAAGKAISGAATKHPYITASIANILGDILISTTMDEQYRVSEQERMIRDLRARYQKIRKQRETAQRLAGMIGGV